MLLFKYDWTLSQGALTWLLILGGMALLYVFNMVVARKKKSAADAEAEKPSGDDLTQLAGINAAIQQALQAAGITTFAHLAEADLAKLRQILQEAGLPLGDLETWLEQARLAASGDWQALAEWKERYAAGEGAA
ncbi:MAG: hypothetical protein GYA59_15555 [Chloroflexi bacterium]|nr:hypothetical protein [Chloroflexota bacterium]